MQIRNIWDLVLTYVKWVQIRTLLLISFQVGSRWLTLVTWSISVTVKFYIFPLLTCNFCKLHYLQKIYQPYHVIASFFLPIDLLKQKTKYRGINYLWNSIFFLSIKPLNWFALDIWRVGLDSMVSSWNLITGQNTNWEIYFQFLWWLVHCYGSTISKCKCTEKLLNFYFSIIQKVVYVSSIN